MFPTFNLYDTIVSLPGILIGFTFHELAHAYLATIFGDPTPGRQGRLTANPLAHIDIWGLLLIIFAGFGWAKPVETNPSNYHTRIREKDIAVSVVGPAANLLIAVIVTAIIFILHKAGVGPNSAKVLFDILGSAAWINCVLFIFNLVPIPPLDGFHILADVLPNSFYRFVEFVQRYGYIILLIFILSPLSDYVVQYGATFIYSGVYAMFGM